MDTGIYPVLGAVIHRDRRLALSQQLPIRKRGQIKIQVTRDALKTLQQFDMKIVCLTKKPPSKFSVMVLTIPMLRFISLTPKSTNHFEL